MFYVVYVPDIQTRPQFPCVEMLRLVVTSVFDFLDEAGMYVQSPTTLWVPVLQALQLWRFSFSLCLESLP